MDQHTSLFHGPYEETVSIPLSEDREPPADEFDRGTELKQILESAPGQWSDGVKSFHTDHRDMDQTISIRSLCNKLTEPDYCRSVVASLPPMALKQLERILRNTADCSPGALVGAFAGHAKDQFWLSPDNPGWSLLALKNTGLIYPTSFTRRDAPMFIPSELQEIVQEIVDDPPESENQFPVPESERFRLRLPGKSYFRNINQRIRKIGERLLAGETIRLDHDRFTPFLNDPFKMLLLFLGIIGDRDTDFRTLKKPVGRFVRKLVSHQDCSDFADLLVEVMWSVPGDVHFIVGTDSREQVRCKLWNTLAKEYFGSADFSPAPFCLGEFQPVWLQNRYFYSFQQRFSLLVPLILHESPDPVDRARDWIHEQAEANLIVNESLPSGILRWVEQGPHDLDREQSLTVLRQAIDHRRSGIRRTGYRILRDEFPNEFQDVLPEARQDNAKKVREWAEDQDQQQLL